MMTDDGRPCLADVGLNARLCKVKYTDAWPIPPSWMFKAPEELAPQCDPSLFSATKEMDVYAFASTVFTVSLCVFAYMLPPILIRRRQIFTLRLPLPAQPYGKGIMKIIVDGHTPNKPAEISDALWDLLERCWSYNPI